MMKILKVDKDKAQVELTKEEFNKLIDTYVSNGSTMIIQFDLPDCRQRPYTKEEFEKKVKDMVAKYETVQL